MIRVAPIFCKAMSKYKRTVVDHSLLGNRVNGNVSLIVAKNLVTIRCQLIDLRI